MINAETIEKAIYNLCIEANTILPDSVFDKILSAYHDEENLEEKQNLGLILENATMSYETKKPLCQDTGQVLVFARGRCFPENFNEAITNGVKKAYEENFYRKSVVKDALFKRENTKTNIPCIIYTEIKDIEGIELTLLIKGGGAENMSQTDMLSPTSTQEEIIEFVVNTVKKAGTKACPPLFIGVGIGGTMEYAGFLSKKALLLEDDISEEHKNLAEKIKNAINKLKIGTSNTGGRFTTLDVKILTDFTHIASLPVAVTINCHSSRHAKAIVTGDESQIKGNSSTKIQNYLPQKLDFAGYKKLHTSEIEKIKNLKIGDMVLLSGEIYTARDMAHKKIVELIEKGEKLPFDIKDKIIFYAGPCPCKEDEIVGSIGPTTSSRMDKFAPKFYAQGLLATIGKGERSEDTTRAIKQNGGLYFTVLGGVACYLSEKFVKKELIAFEELGTEAVYKFEVKDFPVKVETK